MAVRMRRRAPLPLAPTSTHSVRSSLRHPHNVRSLASAAVASEAAAVAGG
eukprot:CAMPEP_0174842550 /NCGR_PEP_ID=MMETSP1114-20130205/9986_1 /TAXON_ID=312471 /ORGANISM="Neobodo designis, Strain CCAP 1951/1" /LENGTH=49 /DNA_ID= /DNA_START= /DNA_END= /DNA_ORIENTATION=